MLKSLLVAGILTLPALCAQAGTTVFRIEMLGADNHRRAVIHIPEQLLETKTPSPVIFALHDQGSTPSIIERHSNLLERADAEGVIVVFPAGHRKEGAEGLHWNVSPFGTPFEEMTPESDVDFIDRIIAHLEDREVLDKSKIFLTGFGSGGSMAYRLACEQPGKFRGVASVSGSMTTETCAAGASTSVLHLHGLGDRHIPYLGGLSSPPKNASHMSHISDIYKGTQWPDTMSRLRDWERQLSCGEQTTESTNQDTICTVRQCDQETMVKSCVSLSAKHEWMGNKRSRPGVRNTKPKAGYLDATAQIWDFVRNFSGPKSTPTNNLESDEVFLETSP